MLSLPSHYFCPGASLDWVRDLQTKILAVSFASFWGVARDWLHGVGADVLLPWEWLVTLANIGPPALSLALVRFGSPSPAWKARSILLHSTVYAPLPNHLFLRFHASGILHFCLQVFSCKGCPFLHSFTCVGYYLYFPLLKDPQYKVLVWRVCGW